ncbi:WXG100 family type VII secretion target [Kitasatospora sp. NPDC050543]|uniref:WXG100 family type VII secretion target n=1 Tax=Kitasatospora sp. NPDC050543 TaxID=3364054 RepID=UPI0037BB57B4
MAPSGSGYKVDPDELDAAGKNGHQVASAVPGETKVVLIASDQAEGSLRGWQTGAALNDCTDAWRQMLDEFAKEIDQTAANLTENARTYREGDANVARAMNPPVAGPGNAGVMNARLNTAAIADTATRAAVAGVDGHYTTGPAFQERPAFITGPVSTRPTPADSGDPFLTRLPGQIPFRTHQFDRPSPEGRDRMAQVIHSEGPNPVGL